MSGNLEQLGKEGIAAFEERPRPLEFGHGLLCRGDASKAIARCDKIARLIPVAAPVQHRRLVALFTIQQRHVEQSLVLTGKGLPRVGDTMVIGCGELMELRAALAELRESRLEGTQSSERVWQRHVA